MIVIKYYSKFMFSSTCRTEAQLSTFTSDVNKDLGAKAKDRCTI